MIIGLLNDYWYSQGVCAIEETLRPCDIEAQWLMDEPKQEIGPIDLGDYRWLYQCAMGLFVSTRRLECAQ